jgi:D-tagatose-1,6-bisphosphate aldolase subunit GatZ/KbaZ
VVAVVVRPGIDFSSQSIAAYNPRRTASLVKALQGLPGLVYEAHSTDFQACEALQRMVADHFAVLKVGPALTFAFREATFALARIEAEALGHRKGLRLSRVIETVESEMLRDPIHWQRYYHGPAAHQALMRRYAYSDRIRYYWSRPPVRAAFSRLMTNLRRNAMPEPLIRQYLPGVVPSAPRHRLRPDPEDLIVHHIRRVTRLYAAACGISATEALHSR